MTVCRQFDIYVSKTATCKSVCIPHKPNFNKQQTLPDIMPFVYLQPGEELEHTEHLSGIEYAVLISSARVHVYIDARARADRNDVRQILYVYIISDGARTHLTYLSLSV